MEDAATTALDLIGVQPGRSVAEVGARSGEFTWRLAERVGSAGKVFAVETQTAMLDRIKKTVAAHGFSNVKIVRGSEQDPHLPSEKIDLALLAGAYHGFAHPQEILRKILDSLKPDGKLVIVEYRKEDQSLSTPPEQRMSIQDIRSEVEAEGYKFEKVVGMLPHQHIVIFAKAPPN